ncbi:16S rRNA (cytosine(1402)-N(4))-methyltransferase RsmH [Candidatus Tokpelaia sp.]|nr:16S rRNA (cytosine(1402)-N(4))-methyltransferase RsmH [Candidatus Tokpelaia sp.]
MLAEVLAALAAQPARAEADTKDKSAALAGLHIIDGTFGNGGYSRAFLAAGADVLGLDRDPQAVRVGRQLAEANSGHFAIIETEFSKLDKAAQAAGFAPVDAVVLDIGVSSMQIDEAQRGFSFRRDGPLDMRMSGRGVSAAAAVNSLKSGDLARIFHFYGEERHAGRIARMIERRRADKAFTTTLELAQAVEAMGLHRYEKIHAATRIFQALRIYVNDELGELARALFAAERVLRAGGCLAVVTFHSLEDRIVKRFFASRAGERPASRHLPAKTLREAAFTPLFKGAKPASPAEVAQNPRARSARLRAGLRTQSPPLPADFSIFGLPELPVLAAQKLNNCLAGGQI